MHGVGAILEDLQRETELCVGLSCLASPYSECVCVSCVSLQIVLENSSREDKHECPFGRSSIELTKMLCEILKVGELRKSTRHLNPSVELSRRQ